jgi:HK97 gp10 family phage protein
MAKTQVIGTSELKAKFEALDEAVRGETLAAATLAGGMVLLNKARKNIKDLGLIRTRTLSRSLSQKVVEQSATAVAVEVGTNLEYAAIQEYGGTVTAKKSKYLAIPLTKTARGAGSPRNFPLTLHLVKGGSGNLVLVSDEGQAHYVLKTSVTIPARPYLRPAFDDNKEEIRAAIGDAIKTLILKAAE